MAVAAVCHGVLDFTEVRSAECSTLYQYSRESGDCLCTTCTGRGCTFTVLTLCEVLLCATISGGVTSPMAATATDVRAASPIGGVKVKKPKDQAARVDSPLER